MFTIYSAITIPEYLQSENYKTHFQSRVDSIHRGGGLTTKEARALERQATSMSDTQYYPQAYAI